MMMSKGVLCRRLSSLPSPPQWTQHRAAAASTAMCSHPPQNISENNGMINRHVLAKSTAETSSQSSNVLLAYGVAASAAAAVIYQSSGHQNSSHQRWGGVTRRYHNTAHCESNNRSTNNNNQKHQNDPQEKEGSDPDSFFDLAQQWANEVLLSKSNSTTSAGGNNDSGTKVESISVPSTTEIDTPEEALLYKLGLIGNKSSSMSAENNDDQPSTSKDNLQDSKIQNNSSITRLMQSAFSKIQDELQSSIPKPSSSTDPATPEGTESSTANQQESDAAKSFADNVSSFFSRKSSNPDIAEIIQQAQNIANNDGASQTLSSSSSSGFLSQVLYFQQNAKSIQKTLESSFGPYISDDINLSDLFQSIPSIAAAHYYLEHQESIKTPSWKRRRHRFQPSVEVMKVNELNEALILSELSYADSVEEVREGLESLYDEDWSDEESGGRSKKKDKRKTNSSNKAQWELLFCDTQSRPNEPSHFLAIQKNASQYDDTLHVLMVVRGTKSMGDLITDAMMEATDYEYDGVQGKAHVGITRSGEYLTKRHKKLLATLLQLSDKRKLDVTLIGHSLGAGAATIAAMNMMNSDQFARDIGNGGDNTVKISANVIGFGCPALLSQNLSLMTRNFVTTVIADADVIPRMSGATLVNLLLDLNQFEYQDLAERDVEQALRELQGRFSDSSPTMVGNRQSNKQVPFSIDEDAIQKVMGYVHRSIDKVSGGEGDMSKPSGKNVAADKMIPCLFPPGTCIHFYRDGSGIDGAYVPCTFFDEIDVARTMVDDHLISSGYRKIFLNMMRDFHKDDHFSFERRRT